MSATNGTQITDAEARVTVAADRILEHWVQAGNLERKEIEAAIRAAMVAGPRREASVVAENMQRALDACDGHIVQAATMLGVSAKTMYLRLNGRVRPELGLRRRTRGATI